MNDRERRVIFPLPHRSFVEVLDRFMNKDKGGLMTDTTEAKMTKAQLHCSRCDVKDLQRWKQVTVGVRFPYQGPIEVGDVFEWMPTNDYAAETCVVTRIETEPPGGRKNYQDGRLLVMAPSGTLVFYRGADGQEVFHTEERFRECVAKSIWKPECMKI